MVFGNLSERVPAKAWHPSVFIQEEMDARGWSRDDLAIRMGGDFGVARLALDFYFEAGPADPDLLIGDGAEFARAFGVSAEFFLNLEKIWRTWIKNKDCAQVEPGAKEDR